MARHTYLLSYDIRDPARWRQVHKKAKGHGEPLQLSVFRCELSELEVERLRADLEEIIHHREDQVMLVDLGPLGGLEADRILYLGVQPAKRDSGPTII